MKKVIYTLSLFVFLVMLTSSVNSFKNKTLVVSATEAILILPDEIDDYSVEVPQLLLEELEIWGPADLTTISNLDNDIATLGRVLFYDDRLSGDNSLSCGSCHKQELSFADDVAFSEGIDDQLTTRNSMNLNDLGWQLGTSFFWDLRSSSLQDAVLQPILAAHELGKDMPTLIAKIEAATEYGPLFQSAYGSTQINETRIASALTQFIASMSSFDSKHDAGFENGFSDFTTSELNGRSLFSENCSFCHFSPQFGSADPFILGFPGTNGLDSVLTDLGMGGWMNDQLFMGVFKSPSLRNVEVTAPYMHDGRFETLEDVIDFYSEGVQPNENSTFNWIFGEDFTGYDFSDSEKEDLLNFMETLTDETLLTDPKWSNPWFTPTSVSSNELTGVSVYPNPVVDEVVIEFETGVNEVYDIAIYDVNGKLINSFQTSDKIVEVPRNNVAPGIYELVASNGKQQKTFKLVYQ